MPFCSKRHADTDFVGALAHRIGDKCVNSDGRENQSQQGKRTQNIFENGLPALRESITAGIAAIIASQREFDVDLRKRAV